MRLLSIHPRLLTVVLLTITLLAAALLSACQTPAEAPPTDLPEKSVPVAAALPSPTDLPPSPPPIPTDTAVPPPPTATPAYETLAPNKIKAGDFTLEATVELYTDELRFNVMSEYPTSLDKDYPDGNMPQPFKTVDIQIKDKPVTLKAMGGGGGGGTDGGMSQRGQGIYYRLEPALTEGEKEHVTAQVTFGEIIGIPEPVLFEYDLVVKKAPKR